MSKCIVTGGSGFIGSHLMDLLLAEGFDAYALDLRPPRFGQRDRFIEGNILDLDALERAFDGAEFVFHLAAEAKVSDFLAQPVASMETNVMGTVKVLEAARRRKVRRVLFASTEWVYGGVPQTEVDEETRVFPPVPNHIYSSSKIAGEMACLNYASLYQQDFTVMRFGIPFGERAWHGTVTPIFLNNILRNKTITINGEGDSFRQFVYVKDLVKGILACTHPDGANQIVNLNGSRKITVIEIIRTIESILGVSAQTEKAYQRPGDFKGRFVSSKKAKDLFGWEPATPYESAMETYVHWFREHDFAK